jgi:hypothetical protein
MRFSVTANHPFVAAAALMVGLTAAAALGPAPAVANSRIHVTMTAENHHPVVNKNWTYSVKVTTAAGKKLSGTETTNYLYGGTVVGTEKPVNVRFKDGYYRNTIQFPSDAVGQPLTVDVVVHTKDGSGSATWSITVKQ